MVDWESDSTRPYGATWIDNELSNMTWVSHGRWLPKNREWVSLEERREVLRERFMGMRQYVDRKIRKQQLDAALRPLRDALPALRSAFRRVDHDAGVWLRECEKLGTNRGCMPDVDPRQLDAIHETVSRLLRAVDALNDVAIPCADTRRDTKRRKLSNGTTMVGGEVVRVPSNS